MSRKPKIGDEIRLEILDHGTGNAEDFTKAFRFFVYGVVINESKDDYTIANWIESNGNVDGNTEVAVVVKGAILNFKVYGRGYAFLKR